MDALINIADFSSSHSSTAVIYGVLIFFVASIISFIRGTPSVISKYYKGEHFILTNL